jgi:hypothetical protein
MMRLSVVAFFVVPLMAVGPLVARVIGRAQSSSVSAARLHASVDIDSKGVFVYRYTLENGARSTAAIWKMTIDISLPKGARKPSAFGLLPGPGYSAGSSGLSGNVVEGEAVPVGLSAPQPGWAATVGADSTANWVATQDAGLISPTRRLSGFSIASHGPPSLRRFVLSPHVEADQAPIMPPGDDPGDLDRYNHDFKRYVDSQSVAGITLAPTAPVVATTDAWLANLADQVEQARSLGWVATDGITRNLRAKIDMARKAVSRRQLSTAGNLLRELRDEVAAQSGKNLTSEAVALVDLNVQYALQLAAKP